MPLPAQAPEETAQALRAPPWWMLMLEGRAPWEWAATVAASPWWSRLPAGDGHPVLVFPGLATTDLSTVPLRGFLSRHGYTAYPWEQGFNIGPRHGVLHRAQARLEALAEQHGEPVSLLGWSLGGIYARELAKLRPDLVRCVITLGTPFAGPPRATHAWRLYELVSGQSTDDEALLARIREAPPVPTTSIYSRSDGIVAWRCSLNAPAPRSENIEVHASHLGLGVNPLALYAVLDRLAQTPSGWQPFSRLGLRHWLFGQAPLHDGAA